jgi:peptide/nickel transport system permease protein
VSPEVAVEAVATPSTQRLLGRAWRTPTLVAGFLIVGAFVAVALLAPLIATTSPSATDPLHSLRGPSSSHLLGTDLVGHDVFSRLVYATRTDLKVGFLAVVAPFLLGTLIGLLAGYYGGALDSVAMRVLDVVVAFPFYILVVALVFALGPGTRSIYIAIAAVGWVAYCRIIRAETLVARRREYVLAARAAGLGDARVLARHILPNVISQAVVYVMSDIVLVVLAVVTLSYLGLGVQPPTPDWGTMISDGQLFIGTHWGLSVFPGAAVLLLGLGLSLLGDGLADLLRPE